MSTILGRPITMGGSGKLPDIFGDGSDGDLVIKAGETVTLPVPVPHQSVIEKNYASITIEAGGTLTTADYNAGLVLRCQGDCTIHGTIDQSGKAPKTNPDSTYQYPEELACGKGGDGGHGTDPQASGGPGNAGNGGSGMAARAYGGGYGGGGGGGKSVAGATVGGDGGSADGITVDIDDSLLFVGGIGGSTTSSGGNSGTPGSNGGGGGGSSVKSARGGNGGTGAGNNGESISTDTNVGGSGGGGGAGNTGGGVLMLYIGGNLSLDGSILCNGLDGGNGGRGADAKSGTGGGGGGGGGGSVYIVFNGTQTITGNLNVNGGASGSGSPGEAGAIGTTTIKQYEKGMTA